MASVPTLQSLSIVKAAIMICTNANVKTELFRLPESVEGSNIARCLLEKNHGKWEEAAGNILRDALKDVHLPGVALQMLSYHIGSIMPEIWKWLRYLSFTFNVDHDYGVAALTDCFFTSSRSLDKRAAARSVVQDETWDIHWRFEIACLFLSLEDVRPLWLQLAREHQRAYVRNAFGDWKLSLVTSWAYHLSRSDGIAYGCEPWDELWLELWDSAVSDGSDVAVKYYWPKLDPRQRCQIAARKFRLVTFHSQCRRSTDLFHRTFCSDGYAEVLSFLVSQMEDHQKVSILREVNLLGERTVLLDLLACHCEAGFLEMVKVFWSELGQADFLKLFLDIAVRVKFMNDFDHCEHISNCDYRRLLKEFWRQTPFTFKRAAFDQCHDVFALVLASEEDIVKFLLKDAPLEEKVVVPFSGEGSKCLFRLACKSSNPKFAIDLLDCMSLSQTEKREYLLREFDNFLSEFKTARLWCHTMPSFFEFVEFCWQFEAESTKADMRRRIVCKMGNDIVADLLNLDRIKGVDAFLQWCFSTPEEISAFKTEFLKICSPDVHSKFAQDLGISE